MRVSVNKNDPGYVQDPFRYDVYLNGKKLNHCFTADEEKGFVDCLFTDSVGKFWVNEDHLVPCRMWGKVKVRRKNGPN